jgi:hypothetical protein
MHLTVLAVPGCPNGPVLRDRLAAVPDGRTGISVSPQVVCDEGEVARWGYMARPRCLIDGVDPFAWPGRRRWRRCGRRWWRPVMTERSDDGHHLISRFRHGRARQLRPRGQRSRD